MNDIVQILLALLGGGTLTALVTLWLTRRKLAAEREKLLAEAQAEKSNSENTDVDAFSKFKNLLKELQDRNDELYKKTVILEKQITERDRSLEVLHDRLADRDSQLEQNTKTLEHLRNLAKDSPVIETLKVQLEAMNLIALSLQTAQTETTKMLHEKDRIVQGLFDTNRNLELKKPK
jgi:predicted RNase H-like nuclease (RuvC/YqgF family)